MTLLKSINPYTQETLAEFPHLSNDEIEQKLDAGTLAFSLWKKNDFAERSKLMNRAAQVLREQKEKYAKIISQEMGKVIKESQAEIEKCAWVCEYYAENAEEFLAPEPINLADGKKAKILHQPLGIILAVMPWNFPFWQVFRFAAPTLMAGNVGMLKHASNVPQCALAIEEVFTKAGFPEGVFQSLLINSEAATELISDQRIKAVTLTGSEKAGSAVAASAGKHIKKSLLELGGSDPFIVLQDADVQAAAETAVKARMLNFGQSCIAAKRFIIAEEIYDQFATFFMAELEKLTPGDPLDKSADFACMARPDLAEELYAQVKKSVDLGAKILFGGEKPEQDRAHFQPTVLAEIPTSSPAYSEELFGPVATFFKVKSEQEAIALANDSEFGLGASIWTKDLEKAELLAGQIESGGVFINAMVSSNPLLPFGGVKKSGYGRELSRLGILEFINSKTVYLG
ncbi:NAD-dependent succinate-semialdehyde dehydrogenase [Algoriphagus halophytocola]|uniref:NAD-dependent succinate-semialdehyde dehydrogenase n=1 Tax=Algoriphagus halophytocola TaxID=2991499 RepID=A0ABY6MF14_9BACT|nr:MULTISPECIES: NAD-dependent succinate-semialdehyde dehydrogenase [unclassified Algoriphagus]UZD22400.1 NAD-dependent succinate-semialdehyde dehydrogenase [Algoriphagus sp. TR-M5]WBL43659.1 NAD-dependent succinate-semialdehyde dehydrogenase [Algoriphagus sp. TR-M9]